MSQSPENIGQCTFRTNHHDDTPTAVHAAAVVGPREVEVPSIPQPSYLPSSSRIGFVSVPVTLPTRSPTTPRSQQTNSFLSSASVPAYRVTAGGSCAQCGSDMSSYGECLQATRLQGHPQALRWLSSLSSQIHRISAPAGLTFDTLTCRTALLHPLMCLVHRLLTLSARCGSTEMMCLSFPCAIRRELFSI